MDWRTRDRVATALDQLIYARQREWCGWIGHDKLKLRDLATETVMDVVRDLTHDNPVETARAELVNLLERVLEAFEPGLGWKQGDYPIIDEARTTIDEYHREDE